MEEKNNDQEVAEFLTAVCQKITSLIDKEVMDEFDVRFEYHGLEYHLCLTKKKIQPWKKLFRLFLSD